MDHKQYSVRIENIGWKSLSAHFWLHHKPCKLNHHSWMHYQEIDPEIAD